MSFLYREIIRTLILSAALCLGIKASGQQWTQTTSLPQGYTYQSLAYSTGYLYHCGGYSDGGPSVFDAYVYFAQVYSNGLVGPWTRTTSLPVPTFSHAGVAANGNLYVLGGYEALSDGEFSITDTVYYANLNTDGSVGSWLPTTSLPCAIVAFGAATWNGQIYITGGNLLNGFTNGVWSAQIQPNGSLSPWVSQPSLPIPLCAHACTANGTIYAIGGVITNGTNDVNTAYYSEINEDGSLGPWNTTTPLPVGLVDPSAVAANGRVYVLGGGDTTGSKTNAWYAPVVAHDGSLGNWSEAPALPKSAGLHDTACTGSNIILTGGFSLDDSLNNVYTMTLPAPPKPPSLNLQSTLGVGTQLTFISVTNTGFGFLASSDMINWVNIGSGFTTTNGQILFQDTNSLIFSNQFYRAYWPLP